MQKSSRRRRVADWVGPSLLIVTLLVPACGGGGGAGAEPAADVDLADRVFVSTEVLGRSLVPGSEIRMTFGDNRVSVQAGCNTHNGGATWDTGVLAVAQPLASTMMACPEDLMDQDDWLRSFLESSPRLRLEGATLRLGEDDDGIVLQEQ